MRLNRSGLLAALVVALSITWPSFTLVALGANRAVSIMNFSYLPKTVQVSVGDTITWTNNDFAPHSATAVGGAWDTGVMNPGSPPPSKTLTFNVPGTFNYQCSIHGPSMSGTVTVVGQAPATTAPPPTVAATPVPTAPPTTAPPATDVPSPSPSPTASPSPAPVAAASPTASATAARPASPAPDPPDLGAGPGPVLVAVAVIVVAALAGMAVALRRRR